jgi:hypothetical protein
MTCASSSAASISEKRPVPQPRSTSSEIALRSTWVDNKANAGVSPALEHAPHRKSSRCLIDRSPFASPITRPVCATLRSVAAHRDKTQVIGAYLRCLRVVEVAFDAPQPGLVRYGGERQQLRIPLAVLHRHQQLR